MKVVALIFGRAYPAYLMLAASFTIAVWCYIIYEYSPNFTLSLSIFIGMRLYYFAFSNIRQSIAIAIVLVALIKLLKGKKTSAVLLIGIAASFHISALIAFGYFIAIHFKLTKRNILFVIAIGITGYVAFTPLLNGFLRIFAKYNSYLQSQYLNSMQLADVVNVGIFLMVSLLLIFLFRRIDSSLDFETKTFLLLTFVAFSLSILSLKSGLLNRIVYYYSIGCVFAIPRLFNYFKLNISLYFLEFMTGGLFIIYNFIVLYLRPDWNILVPYHVFF
jgi:hypothetical protein